MKQSEINRLRRGKRGHARGSWNKSIKAASRKLDIRHSTTHKVANGLGYISNELSDCFETVEDHIVPRESLTDKQELRNKVRPLAGVVVKGCIVRVKDGVTINTQDKVNPGKNIVVTLMSDKSLLNKGNPFRDTSHLKLKRQTSKTKHYQYPDRIRDIPNSESKGSDICLDLNEDLKN